MKKLRLWLSLGLSLLVLVNVIPMHIGAEVDIPKILISPAPKQEAEIEDTEELAEEEDEKPDRLLMVSSDPISVDNALYFEFDYYSTTVDCWSENTDIVQVALIPDWYDPEVGGIAGVMVYGITDGTAEIVIQGDDEVVRRSVTVEKPVEDTGEQRIMDHLLQWGETNDLGDKVVTKTLPEWNGEAIVEYDCWDENISFYYIEENDTGKIEWHLMTTEKDNTEYYITMNLGDDFVTAVVDLVTYDGEELALENAWYREPAAEELQVWGNEVNARAFEAVKELLYEETGMVPAEIYRVYEPEVIVPEMG